MLGRSVGYATTNQNTFVFFVIRKTHYLSALWDGVVFFFPFFFPQGTKGILMKDMLGGGGGVRIWQALCRRDVSKTYFLLISISIWLAGRLGGILFCFFLPFLRHGHLGGNFFWVFFSPTFPRKRVFFFFKKKES